ncbi:MAG TPA: PEP-CTERM sorting domain-containing protein [Rhodanobacteraceae bacterium]|nr:PEP-CTERM sorting domain-containing protein [Rhodanobacteraceae bacterium]
MNTLKRQMGCAVVLIAGLLACGIASAGTVVMTFDQLNPNGEYVGNYYNGGCGDSLNGGSVTCGGPSYGITWTHAIAGNAPGGIFSNASGEPSSPGVIGGFDDNTGSFMNVAAGFDTGFSFYYAAANTPGSISVYSGLNGTGTLLTSLALPVNGANCNGASEDYSCWSPIGVSFTGTAESVNFGGSAFYIAFDNVTLGASTPGNPGTPVPEPAALGMFGFGALLIGLFAGMRRRTQQI